MRNSMTDTLKETVENHYPPYIGVGQTVSNFNDRPG